MNKGEQRRLYSSQLQKIVKKNIKNNISFSINNYNNNTTNNNNQNDFEHLYKNVNNSKLNEGIRGLNKSLDLSRNKSPTVLLRPNFKKNENATTLKTNKSNGTAFIQNNKSVDFANYDINSLNYKNENLGNMFDNSSIYIPSENIMIRNNSKFKIKKDLLDDVLSKYHTHINNRHNYSNDLSNISSIKNQNTLTHKNKYSILNANEKSIDNYIKNPISNDSVLNINLFGNELSDSNHKINLTNINSLSEFERLYLYKNIDSQTKNSSKYLEMEDSHFNNPIINSNSNKQVKLNNLNDGNFSSSNIYKIIDGDSQYKKLNKINFNTKERKRPDSINDNFDMKYHETDTEINNTSCEHGPLKISNYAKIKDFYSRNNKGKLNDLSSNLINENDEDIITHSKNIEKNNSLGRPYYPFLIPSTNKNLNSNKIHFNFNMNNSINTPTKLFQNPGFRLENKIGENITKINDNNIVNSSLFDKSNFYSSSKKINPQNKHIVPNLNFNNSIRNRILQNSIKNPNLSPNNSKEFNDIRKIINPKIRIVSRNINERANYDPHTANDKNINMTEDINSFINKTSPSLIEDKNTFKIENNYIGESQINVKNSHEKVYIQNKEQIIQNSSSLKEYSTTYMEQSSNNKLSEDKKDDDIPNYYNSSNRNDVYIYENKNTHIKDETKNMIKESSKNSSTIDEGYKNHDTKSEHQKKLEIGSNQYINNQVNCKNNIKNNQNQNEKDPKGDSKEEYIRPDSRNEEEKEMTFNSGNNYQKNFNDIVSTTSKEAILDENDAHLAFINKSSKNSSQKDYVNSDSNEVEEIEISGKLASMDYSSSTLKKICSTHNSLRDKNEKMNSKNTKNIGSNCSLKNNNLVNQTSNYTDSKMTILDISGLKNCGSNSKFFSKDSEKEMIIKSQFNKNISKEDKVKIENLIKNLDKKVYSRKKNDQGHNNNNNKNPHTEEENTEIKKKVDEMKITFKTNSLSNKTTSFGVFREVEEKVILIQKHSRFFLRKLKNTNNFERLVSFWDKTDKNLVTMMISIPDKQTTIVNVNEISLKIKVYSVESGKIIEKTLTNEPFLYKLQRHKRINLKSLKEFFLALKDNLEMKDEKIVYVSDPKSPKSKGKDIFNKNGKKKFSNEILDELNKSKLSDQINKQERKEEVDSSNSKTNTDKKDLLTPKKINKSNKIKINEVTISDKEVSKNNIDALNSSNKVNETGSIHFKDELRNVYKNKKKEKNKLISITTLNSNSYMSPDSPNSIRHFNNTSKNNINGETIDRLESLEYPVTNRFKEVNLSNENILNNSIQVDSKYFYDDISTKTINTCSIRDDNFESDDDYDI